MTARARKDEGQVVVELALALPLVALLALLLLQVALIVRDQVLVTSAAREGARQMAVSPEEGEARAAVLDGTALDDDRLTVTVGPRGAAGSRVRVEIRYRSPTEIPLVGAMMGDVDLTAAATMRVEK